MTRSDDGQPEHAEGHAPTRRRAGLQLAAVGCGLLLLGCGTPAPKPTRVEASIVAAGDLNPSVNDRPSPVLLRVYELRSQTAFNQADFMTLYQSDQASLAADLVAREEMMLQPGEKRSLNKQLAPDTRFIGVVAAYRDLERAIWRAVVPVTPGQQQSLTVRADRLAVSATVTR